MQWGSRMKATIWVSPCLAAFFSAGEGSEGLDAGSLAAETTRVFPDLGPTGDVFLSGVFAALRGAFGLAAAFGALAGLLPSALFLVSIFFFGGIGPSQEKED